jgi:isoleucyl-tRNA synthetase
LEELVLEELNVKALDFAEDRGELVEFALKPDPGLLGPRYGPQLPGIRAAVASVDAASWAKRLRAGEAMEVAVEGETIELLPEEIAVEATPRQGYAVSEEGDYMVGVETTLSAELVQEGLARELVRRIQNLRKEAGFRIEDKIATYYQGDAALSEVMRDYGEYIADETLSVEMAEGGGPKGSHAGQFTIDGREMVFHLLEVPAEVESG